jgi:hypothetical protein
MALQYILSQFGNKIGLNPSDASQRATLLRYVNAAAKELYQQSDMAGCLEECLFKVNSNQTIALPDYVGQIRAMREHNTTIAITLSQMRPRYNQFSWSSEWRNWRILGLQTLQQSIKNQSVLTISVKCVENPPIVVNITGGNDNSSYVTESLTMTAPTMTTTLPYNTISSFTKNAVNGYDVTLTDVEGNVLSSIANNKLKASFQVVDISSGPWTLNNTNPMCSWIEVLYKKALLWFANDNDEFPAVGYDDVLVDKCLQLYKEEQGDVAAAMAYMQKATQSLAQIHEDANRGADDVVALVANPHDRMAPRVGYGRDYRYAGRYFRIG